MPDKKPTSTAHESLRTFLSRTRAWEDPSAVYTFDGERGAPRSELCREAPSVRQDKRKDCVVRPSYQSAHPILINAPQLDMYSTQLFEAMQKYGFYCALPSDPTRTHMVCRKIPQK